MLIDGARIRCRANKLKEYLAIKTDMVNHREVIREVAVGVDRSWVYYLMLLMAGLIALLGLLTNSVAVVIGAMLISPLMGPIISSGLALTIGDLPLARRAFRTIAVSVALTIMVTAAVTLLSPLKEPTAEILARVRPNIYDLFVAMLSGIVGAVALCTKRNYLITATGVAVATAVIPPLSVAGYGLGTGQFMLGMGGFLLFFTNFVAIILTSDLVFFIMGFRTSHVETIQYPQRTRLMIVAGLLALISIPLIHTLVVDLRTVKTKSRIERVLKKHLNAEQVSRMTGYVYRMEQGKLLVQASVNTVTFIDASAEKVMEAELAATFKEPVELRLEQVIVASGKLPDTGGEALRTDIKAPAQIAGDVRGKAGALATQISNRLEKALVPFPVSNVRIVLGAGAEPLTVTATLGRDYPVSEDELVLLGRLLEHMLEMPVRLHITVTPFLPPLKVTETGTLDSSAVAALVVLRQLPGGGNGFRFLIRTPDRKLTAATNAVRRWLQDELGVAPAAIIEKTVRRGGDHNTVTLLVVRN